MPRTVPVEVRITGLPEFRRFAGSVAVLLAAIDRRSDLPASVTAAADQVRRDAAELRATG